MDNRQLLYEMAESTVNKIHQRVEPSPDSYASEWLNNVHHRVFGDEICHLITITPALLQSFLINRFDFEEVEAPDAGDIVILLTKSGAKSKVGVLGIGMRIISVNTSYGAVKYKYHLDDWKLLSKRNGHSIRYFHKI